MGPLRREMMSHADGSTGLVLGGETASLLDVAPRAPPPRGDPLSRTLETRGEGGASYYTEGLPLHGLHSYHAQPVSPSFSRASPPPGRRRDTSTSTSSKSSKNNPKTRFPSLTPPSENLSPTPGNFSAAGDARAAGAVAHARKTWAPPALRTQAIASYGAVPDLEVRIVHGKTSRWRTHTRVAPIMRTSPMFSFSFFGENSSV
ncbi:unnamed protein product [Pylaiella littoralis]